MPPFPFELEYLWDLFFEFAAGLVSFGMAPAQASWLDVQAFCGAMQLELEPIERRILISLANLRASIQAEAQASKAKAKS